MKLKLIADVVLISTFWFIAIYTMRVENIDQLAWKQEKLKVEKYFGWIAKILILLVFILEIVLGIGNYPLVLVEFRNLLKTPFISNIILLSNFWVIFYATRKISMVELIHEKQIEQQKKESLAFADGLIVLSISMILYYVQSVFWGNFNYLYSSNGEIKLIFEIVFGIVLILTPAILLFVNSIKYIIQEKVSTQAVKLSVPVITFMSLTQMIVTRVLVVLDVFYWIMNKLKKTNESFNDPLYIASSMMEGNVYSKINGYFLTAYFFPMTVLWITAISPLPPNRTLYMDGITLSLFFSASIFLFWMIEKIARKIRKYGNLVRLLFVPIMILLTIFPYYTELSGVSSYVKEAKVESLYHTMAFALGNTKYLFFICLAILQGSIGYIMHIITGEAHNEKHHYSVIPIVCIIQIMLLCFLYPIIVSCPPYFLQAYKGWINFGLLGLGLMVTISMGLISHHIFSARTSQWAHYIGPYWKDRARVIAIVGIISFFAFFPVSLHVKTSIENMNISVKWEKDFFNPNYYTATNLLKSSDSGRGYLLMNGEAGGAKLTSFSLEDGQTFWEKRYVNNYYNYTYWPSDEVVLEKTKNQGFSIINLKKGNVVYDYEIQNANNLEFFSIDANSRTVLVTENTKQFLVDYEYGEISLETLGNNFYELIPGNQCSIIKDYTIYTYKEEQWMPIKDIYGLNNPEFIYYDENGLLIFTKDEIIKYNYELTEMTKETYPKSLERVTSINNNYYDRVNNEVVFYMYDQLNYYAYVFDVEAFTYKIVPLSQKIKGFHDLQAIQLIDNKNKYLLYDDYQFSIYENENLIARQWFAMPNVGTGIIEEKTPLTCDPIYINDIIIWAEQEGTTHAVEIKKMNK